MANTIRIDFQDLPAMRKVMDEYHTTETMLFGKTENDELTLTSIFKDRIVLTTYQNNHWIRVNVLHRDGTIEELYEGKWE